MNPAAMFPKTLENTGAGGPRIEMAAVSARCVKSGSDTSTSLARGVHGTVFNPSCLVIIFVIIFVPAQNILELFSSEFSRLI